MKQLYTLLFLCFIVISTYSQNTSKYEAPEYFPEMPYDGIIGEVDSMVTYTLEAANIHRDSVLKTNPPIGKCIAVKRQHFDKNGRRTLLEESKINDQGIITLFFREITKRDNESLPTSRIITRDGITSHYILQSRDSGTEVYKIFRNRSGHPSIPKDMTVTYRIEAVEFDMGEDHIETELNTIVTTTIQEAGGLQTIFIDEYSEDGFCYSSIKTMKDAMDNEIYNSNESNNNEEGISQYSSIIEEDDWGNYAVLGVYNAKDILQNIQKTQFFYREE